MKKSVEEYRKEIANPYCPSEVLRTIDEIISEIHRLCVGGTVLAVIICLALGLLIGGAAGNILVGLIIGVVLGALIAFAIMKIEERAALKYKLEKDKLNYLYKGSEYTRIQAEFRVDTYDNKPKTVEYNNDLPNM